MKTSFEENKLKRLINTQGQFFVFKRYGENDFGEYDPDTPIAEIEVKGVYHETTSYVSVTESTATRSQTKPVPMVLTLWKSIENNPVKLDDKVEYNGKEYRVTGVTNIQERNYGADISLEVIV